MEETNEVLENTTEVSDERRETYEAISELTHEKTIPSKSSTSGEPNDGSLGGEEDDALPLFSVGVSTWRASS